MSVKGWPISARSASLQTIEIALADYKPHPQNPNTHPGPQLDALGDSLDQFEQVKNIVVWRGHYIAGHGLAAAATRRGLKTLAAVDVSEWDEGRAVSFMLADNRLSDMAIMDETALTDLLASIDEPLEIPGFDEDFLKSLDFGDDPPKDAPPQIDRAAELAVEWETALGQVWQLGEHRLACGDCTDREVVEKVMEDDAILFTDPPYGIEIDTSWLSALNMKRGKPANLSDNKLQGDDGSLDLSFLFEFDKRMIWGFPYIFDPYATGWVVWDKQPGVDKRGIVTPIEMASTTLRKGFDMIRVMWGGYYRAAGETREPHPTQKPVGVISPFIGKWTKTDDTVYDPFLGSGTTLIACEQLGRQCRGIEIDPGYAAVILQRYLDATGERGELVANVTV